MKKPFISVVVTAKNEEQYIEKTLVSVKNQTYNPIEIIVVDSCSTDKTVKIAKKYADKIIVRKTNISEGKNLGAEKSNGEFLVFLDADTIILPTFITNAVTRLMKGKYSMIVGSYFSYEGNFKLRLISKFFSDVFPMINSFFKYGVYGGMSTFVLRKKIFEKVGRFNEELTFAEDVDFCAKINKIGKIFQDKKCICLSSMRRFIKSGSIKESLNWISIGICYFLFKKLPPKTYNHFR